MVCIGPTSCTRLSSPISKESQDHRSSLHTKRPKGPKKSSRMKHLHGFLHGILWIVFHGLPTFASNLPSRSRLDLNSIRPCQLNKWYNLWMKVKSPQNYMFTTLGSCVTLPIDPLIFHRSNTIFKRPSTWSHIQHYAYFSSIQVPS